MSAYEMSLLKLIVSLRDRGEDITEAVNELWNLREKDGAKCQQTETH